MPMVFTRGLGGLKRARPSEFPYLWIYTGKVWHDDKRNLLKDMYNQVTFTNGRSVRYVLTAGMNVNKAYWSCFRFWRRNTIQTQQCNENTMTGKDLYWTDT